MATTVDECLKLVEAERRSGKVYMMMETAVYTREFLYALDLADLGEARRLQFLRGSHSRT
jgi:predicted dehydrogenase